MKPNLKVALLAVSLFAGLFAMAQPKKGDAYMSIFYSAAVPTGNFKSSFVDRTSWRGSAIDLMWYVSDELALGASLAFQDFYQKTPRDLYQLSDGSDMSAVRSRSLQTIPLMMKANYFPVKMKTASGTVLAGNRVEPGLQVLPYFSLGAGVNMVPYQQLYGIFTSADDFRAGFAAMAGAGLKVPFGRFMQNGFVLEANYNLMPFNHFVMTNVNHFNFRLGFQFEMQ
ncbi:MAG TPA: hypothetical protein VLL95_15365 [Phnomibacter sp.]|nr:hypothetical protein [Phnomibacter sp.]